MPPKPQESDTFERVRSVADLLVLEFRPYGLDAVVCLRLAADELHAEIQSQDGHGPARPRKGDVRRVGVSGAPRRVGVAAERAAGAWTNAPRKNPAGELGTNPGTNGLPPSRSPKVKACKFLTHRPLCW